MAKKTIVAGVSVTVLLVVVSLITLRITQTDSDLRVSQPLFPDRMNPVSEVELPTEDYLSMRTQRGFGEYIADGRFTGYHAGEDVEFENLDASEAVFSIAKGVVKRIDWVSGYGGLMVIEHTIDGEPYTALYGHIDVDSARISIGETVEPGQSIALLGQHESTQTDGERMHLHFGLYKGLDDGRLNGYVSTSDDLKNWVNPADLFESYGFTYNQKRTFNPAQEFGGEIFNLSFQVPAGYEVEYLPSIEALNIYRVTGQGPALERSGIFLRYFDASSFLTLNTVDIYETEDVQVNNYDARRYDIEKKAGVQNFVSQPTWRNERHTVTDVRTNDGFSRFFVIAKAPELDDAIYQDFLQSFRIIGSE